MRGRGQSRPPSEQEAPCHKDKVALPVALQGAAFVLLSLWTVGQRERGPRSPQSRSLVKLGRMGRGLNPRAPRHSLPHKGVQKPWAGRGGRCHPTCPHCWDVAGK